MRPSNMQHMMCDALRIPRKFMAGTLHEAEVRSALTPDAELRYHYDEAMKLVLALTYANQSLRRERDNYKAQYNWAKGIVE